MNERGWKFQFKVIRSSTAGWKWKCFVIRSSSQNFAAAGCWPSAQHMSWGNSRTVVSWYWTKAFFGNYHSCVAHRSNSAKKSFRFRCDLISRPCHANNWWRFRIDLPWIPRNNQFSLPRNSPDSLDWRIQSRSTPRNRFTFLKVRVSI